MNIASWYLSDLHACGHIRAEIVAREVNKNFRHWLFINKQDILMSDFYKTDVMVFQRQHNVTVLEKMKLAKRSGIKCVYECDDDMFNMPPEFAKPYEFYSKPEVQKTMQLFLMNADEITVTTKHLADAIRPRTMGQKIHVIPNYLDIEEWNKPYINKLNTQKDDVTIGWMASGSHKIDAPLVNNVLMNLMAKHPTLKMHFIGWLAEDDFPWIATYKDRVKVDKWVDISILPYAMQDFDIGLAPLVDNTFNKSKSNIKLLQHSALGIPTVASPLNPYTEDIKDIENGFLAYDEEDWFEYLDKLIIDKQLRKDVGFEARKLLVNKYDIKLNVGRWIEVFNNLLKDKR
jgi:glycosyltransferase involved in cell wall biosynthesis